MSGANWLSTNLVRGEADISLRTKKPEDKDLICLASFYGHAKVYVSQALAETLGGTFFTGLTPLPINLNEYTLTELHIVVHKRQRHIHRVVKVAELLEAYFNRTLPRVGR